MKERRRILTTVLTKGGNKKNGDEESIVANRILGMGGRMDGQIYRYYYCNYRYY
jgi:hypothetical protein